MLEIIRRLTANYTEAEYEAWLKELPTLPEEMYRESRQRKDYGYRIADIAYDTGYEPDYLWEIFEDLVEDYIDQGRTVTQARKRALTEVEYEAWLETTLETVETLPKVTGRERNKDIACLLADVADDTGYEPEFLYETFDEVLKDYLEDGMPVIRARRRAFIEVAETAMEQDY